MIKVGIVDKWLNNWHTDHYPDYLRHAADLYGFDIEVVAAYSEHDYNPHGGISADEWCEQKNVKRVKTYEELIDSVDAIMVMCADDCTPHEELARKALMSGKPVFCDKTFAPTYAAAKRMFDLADAHNTPIFTCSAQRFCMEMMTFKLYQKEPVQTCSTQGPGDIVNYSIHQFEMIEMLMGVGAKRCKAYSTGDARHVMYEYVDGRTATFTQMMPAIPFRISVFDKEGNETFITVSDYYMTLMYKMCKFFTDKIPPVAHEDTLEIMKMQEAARMALKQNDTWIELSSIN